MALDIPDADLDALFALIYRLRDTPVLQRATANSMYDTRRHQVIARMLETGETYGSASDGLPLLNQPEQAFRRELHRTEDDLGAQVLRVSAGLNQWFEFGEDPAPHYVNRIAVILRKAKKPELEKAFLAVWCLHFGHRSIGATDEKIVARAKAMGVFGLGRA